MNQITALYRQGHVRSMLDMSHRDVRTFLLKSESYCNLDLPIYFNFEQLLSNISDMLRQKDFNLLNNNPSAHEGVNYSILSNKDGRYAFRPFELIHPAIYCSLVNYISMSANWDVICKRFSQYQDQVLVRCLSIPVESPSEQKDKAVLINGWWHGIEQASIELALDYNYVFHTDIASCYASIYTHTIAWAIHGKELAKSNRKSRHLVGNEIDKHIQAMRHGQTNGISQGSVLMDFIAEMVLGYADLQLSEILHSNKFNIKSSDCLILRYRDDYRVFVQNQSLGERILKSLSEVLSGLGLQLNSSKTAGSSLVVSSSIKPDKWAWLKLNSQHLDLQKHLLLIHSFSLEYPQSGTLFKALNQFHVRLLSEMHINNPTVLISILTDIAYHSPRVFPVYIAITGILISLLPNDSDRKSVIERILFKFSRIPNTGLLEVWLQRICLSNNYDLNHRFTESLCRLVHGDRVDIWNNDWIKCQDLKEAINPLLVVSTPILSSLNPIIQPDEIELFPYRRY